MAVDQGEVPVAVTDVEHLITEGYIPFAEIIRVIPWPTDPERAWENDAEHSHALAFIGAAIGERLGMDPAKITLYATFHDFTERYATDTSVWDEEGRLTKVEREERALEQVEQTFQRTPLVAQVIRDYEAKADEESRFVDALDKIVAAIMVLRGGTLYRENGISFEQFLRKADEIRLRVAIHPVVAQWYEEVVNEVVRRKEELFPA